MWPSVPGQEKKGEPEKGSQYNCELTYTHHELRARHGIRASPIY